MPADALIALVAGPGISILYTAVRQHLSRRRESSGTAPRLTVANAALFRLPDTTTIIIVTDRGAPIRTGTHG
ncbi:hypothetical protein [Cryptosporangium sp. NPDC051539]|uniref:hypothetical protein n=1 Tax=Cryptosporangium sp. NPDC051539 TaxID=3363962 RepID=UPI0037B76318